MSIVKTSAGMENYERALSGCRNPGYHLLSSEILPSYFLWIPIPILNVPLHVNYPILPPPSSPSFSIIQGMGGLGTEKPGNNMSQKEAERILLPIQENNLPQLKNNSESQGKPSPSPSLNQHRNVMPNLIRLVLNFCFMRERSERILRERQLHMTTSDINSFYKYTKRIKVRYNIGNNSYISQKKLQQIFGILQSKYFGNRCIRKRTEKQEIYKEIIRRLSFYYLTTECVSSILFSKKIRRDLKEVHLMKRNRLISILKCQMEP